VALVRVMREVADSADRCTHHSASGDYDALRYLERVTTGGEVPL
jgi:hypothetical protein